MIQVFSYKSSTIIVVNCNYCTVGGQSYVLNYNINMVIYVLLILQQGAEAIYSDFKGNGVSMIEIFLKRVSHFCFWATHGKRCQTVREILWLHSQYKDVLMAGVQYRSDTFFKIMSV